MAIDPEFASIGQPLPARFVTDCRSDRAVEGWQKHPAERETKQKHDSELMLH